METAAPVRLRYFLRIPNVGDRVAPLIVTALAGRPSKYHNGTAPHLLAVGSLLAAGTANSQVWGTGVMHPAQLGNARLVAENIHALRGPLSLAALRGRSALAISDVPFGDPALLAPKLLGITRSEYPTFPVGVVAHYVDRHKPAIQHLMKDRWVADLDVTDPPEEFLCRMADCAAVLSTSLHGLIFAEALGIPSVWIRVGDDIAGGAFKFNDWFATTRRPQHHSYELGPSDDALVLAGRAELHESTVDLEALTAAFPHDRLEEISEPAPAPTIRAEVCRQRPTPVFLISYNRGSHLRQTIEGIRRLLRPTTIVIHDNGSTDGDTLDTLDSYAIEGVRVFRRARIATADELNQVDETIRAFFTEWGEPVRYVVSDCDVDMSIADPAALDIYDALLDRFRAAECVGPMLRISDIPFEYPLFNQVMNRHIEQFWRRHPTEIVGVGGRQVAVLDAPFDTTFGLHRASEPFRRYKKGLRVYEPFEARHLDWYLTSEDDHYARTSSTDISHWNNRAQFDANRHVPLRFDSYRLVELTPQGLSVRERRVRSDDIDRS